MPVTHAHGSMSSQVFAVRMSSSLFHLAFSLLMFHPSLLLLFLHGHFETIPDYDLTDALVPHNPPELSRPQKRRSSALRTRMSRLATWSSSFLSQVMSSRSSTRLLLWTMTRRPSKIRTTVSLTSRKPQARTLDNSVFPQCLNPLFCTFLMVIFVSERKQRQHATGKPLQDRERKTKEMVSVISVAESMSMKSQRSSIRSHSLQTHNEFFSDERDLREHLERRAQQAILGEKSLQKIVRDWVQHGDLKFGTKKFRTHIIRVATRAWISKTTVIGSQSMGRSSSA